MNWLSLKKQLDKVDIYLLDQLIKGHIPPGSRVLDAGCGDGENAAFLASTGCEVAILDSSSKAIEKTKARFLTDGLPLNERFIYLNEIQDANLPNEYFDAIISISVLHFSRNHAHFSKNYLKLWDALAPGGILMVRTLSVGNMQKVINNLGDGRYILPNRDIRFLLTKEDAEIFSINLGGILLEPLREVNVFRKRSFLIWILRKPHLE